MSCGRSKRVFLGVTATEAVAKRRRPVNSILLPRLSLLQCGFVYRGPWGGGWESLVRLLISSRSLWKWLGQGDYSASFGLVLPLFLWGPQVRGQGVKLCIFVSPHECSPLNVFFAGIQRVRPLGTIWVPLGSLGNGAAPS